MNDNDPTPMESPGPIILAVAVVAALVLTGLMITDLVWQFEGPVTAASRAAPAAAAPPPPS